MFKWKFDFYIFTEVKLQFLGERALPQVWPDVTCVQHDCCTESHRFTNLKSYTVNLFNATKFTSVFNTSNLLSYTYTTGWTATLFSEWSAPQHLWTWLPMSLKCKLFCSNNNGSLSGSWNKTSRGTMSHTILPDKRIQFYWISITMLNWTKQVSITKAFTAL
jgi:hypothetical protein